MLIPISRATFEDLVPLLATGAQYRYTWGTFSDFLRRLLVSFAAVIAAVIVGYFMGEPLGPGFQLIAGIIAGCYWLWGPIFLASKENWDYRRYKYSGFWQGEVLDKFVTDELVGTGENVNQRGELVIKENREKRLNLDIGDETGFTTRVNVPLKRDHQGIRRGDAAEMVVVSARPDLGRFAKISDVFVADSSVWVSDYPYIQRAAFEDVSQRLKRQISEAPRDQRRGDRYPQDRYPQNRYPNDHYSENRYPDDRYPEDRYPENRYPKNRYPEDRYPDEDYAQRSREGYDQRDRSPQNRYQEPRRTKRGPRRLRGNRS